MTVKNKLFPVKERIAFILSHPEMTYNQIAPEVGYASGEAVRSFCKRNKLPNKRVSAQSRRVGDSVLADRVAKSIKNHRKTLIDLSDEFSMPPKKIVKAIEELKTRNIVVDNFTDGGFQLGKRIAPTRDPVKLDLSKHREVEYPIGFVADTHIGSKYERMDVLNALYDRFENYGIETVFHGGNWIDGEARFNKFDIYVHGIEAQVANFLKKYPQRKGMTTKIISGDDHEGWYVQREHINIGQVMVDRARAAGRYDLVDLGYMERNIEYVQEGGSSVIRVIHAGGGSTYAWSYTSQKYAESLQGGEKPNIVLVGHFHKFDFSYPREIYMIQGGCFTGNTYIETKSGRKRIKQVIEGELVLTDSGRYKKVAKVFTRDYDGEYIAIRYGRKNRCDQCVTCTEEHPIKVMRDNKISFVPAKEIKLTDYVFTRAGKCKLCGVPIPYWGNMCKNCNPMNAKETRDKLSETRIDTSPGKIQPRSDYLPYDENFVLVRVVALEKKKIKTKKVYNLEVEEDHTYVAGSICVHNCTEDQTPFMRKRKLQAMVGGCVLWVKQNDLGVFSSIKVEWIPFFDKKFYTYNW